MLTSVLSKSHSTSYVCPRATEESKTARRAFAATRETNVFRNSAAHAKRCFIVDSVETAMRHRRSQTQEGAKRLDCEEAEEPSSLLTQVATWRVRQPAG